MRRYIYLFAIIISIVACSEDKGNYNYKDLNTITINNVNDRYSVDQYGVLNISPECDFALGKNIDNLTYEWKIDKKVISTDAELNYTVTEDIAEYLGTFCVTDETTGVKYYKGFELNVQSIFANAMFFLCEKEDGEAMLSYQRRDKEGAPVVNNIFKTYNPKFGSLGYSPKQVGYFSTRDYFAVICGEGDKKITIINPIDMTIESIYNEERILGGFDGVFNPEYLNVYTTGMSVSNGQMFLFDFMGNKSLYRPTAGDYEFASWVSTNKRFNNDIWVSYDNKSEEFKALEYYPGDVAFDKVTSFDPSVSTSGQKFICADFVDDGLNYKENRVLLYDPNIDITYLYNVTIEIGKDYWWGTEKIKTVVKKGEFNSLANLSSVCAFGRKSLYWYIANGKTVTTLTSNEGGTPTEIFTSTKGDITCMQLDHEDERLFVATYDGISGYIYVFNTTTKEIVEEMPIGGKVVSMLPKGDWSY